VNAEINVTSLIDIAFTLLVIFIITAPILQGGVEVRLPQAQVRPITAQEEPFIVTIVEDCSVLIGETPVTAEEFDEIFEGLYEIAQPSTVLIRGDAAASYGCVLPVIATIYAVAAEDGVSVGMVGEPLPRSP
jgi:biopolymer transport protein ExbD/biopolymer transport protein TolR